MRTFIACHPLVILLICLSTIVTAQSRYLLLSKLGKNRKIVFQAGEEVRFKLKEDEDWHKALILGFGEAHIRFRYYEIRLSEIAAIDIRHKPPLGVNLDQYGMMLPIAGAGYFIIDVLSYGNVTPGTLETTGGFIVGGVLLRILRRKLFKVGNRNKITILEQ